MALGNVFKLAKLSIRGFKDAKRQQKLDSPFDRAFDVQFNPETLSLQHESVFQAQQGLGPSAPEGGFSYSRPKRVSVDLVFDGTHVGYMGVELLRGVPTVAERVKEFLAVCYRIHGDIHEPAYLKLSWDQGVLGPSFDCRLQSVQVRYTAFERDGSPLHAELSAVFVEHLDPTMRTALQNLSSPDLTHRRVVVAGDTLPLLCREIYGSAAHYLRVAQVNGLDDFRDLAPGLELFFPPFARTGEA